MKQSFFETADVTFIIDLTALSIIKSIRKYKLCLSGQVIQQVNTVLAILNRQSLAGLDLTVHVVFETFVGQKGIGRSEYIPMIYTDLGS